MAFNPGSITPSTLKALVDNLSRHLKSTSLPPSPKRSQIQEAIAATLGWPNWHAAITVAKARQNPASTTPSAPGRPPVSALQRSNPLISAGSGLAGGNPSSLEKVWHVAANDMAHHAMVWGSETDRRNLLEHVACINPYRPMLIINGPVSLFPRRWSGLVVEPAPLAQALAVDSVDSVADIMESLVSHLTPPPQCGVIAPYPCSCR